MPASKIQDEQEVLRWFAEGKTYDEMSAIYRTKYNIETVPSLWGNFRRRRGLARKQARNDTLIPWRMKEHHRLAYPVAMLRLEARRLEGMDLDPVSAKRLESWKAMLAESKAVVYYDPETPQGFFYVTRTESDDEFIRPPLVKTTLRPRRD